MTLWFVFALMTAAAVFAVLWPLGRAGKPHADGSETSVYRDQLTEVDRDVAAGLINPPEAAAARVEIGRRLLAAADSERTVALGPNVRLRRFAAIIALVGLPLIAVGLYYPLGSPNLPDFPLAQRSRTPDGTQSLDNLVAQVEEHLAANPTDGRGWSILAPVLARLGRMDDAIRAFRNSITYNGESSDRRADLGEALVAAAGGVVTADAKAEFERAVGARCRGGEGTLLPRTGRRTRWPRGRCGVDLACNAGKGAGGCAMAFVRSGRAGQGRRDAGSGALE